MDRLTVNPSLFMVKYDGFDCVYGIELFKDDRVSNLQVLTEKVSEYQLKTKATRHQQEAGDRHLISQEVLSDGMLRGD